MVRKFFNVANDTSFLFQDIINASVNIYAVWREPLHCVIKQFGVICQAFKAICLELVHVELAIKEVRVEVLKVLVMDQQRCMASIPKLAITVATVFGF